MSRLPRIVLLAGLVAAPAHAEFYAGTGLPVSPADFQRALARADFILLGELHDNPHHHTRRARIVRELATRRPTVVLEQLDAGVVLDPRVPLTAALAQAGFDEKAWGWPLHKPVFDSAQAAGLALIGGNLARDATQKIARDGAAAVPPELTALLNGAPLSPAASAALDRSLIDGHCGHALGKHADSLRLAQRARDARLAQTLLDARRPALLIAGNGHVRRDYGVPQLLARLAPLATTVAVGFVEHADDAVGTPYDYVVVTAAAQRDDPCKAFAKPLAPASKP
jgi:uncharacterized iron-regulated protein